MIDFYVEKDIDLIYEELIKSFDLITRDQIINEQKLTIPISINKQTIVFGPIIFLQMLIAWLVFILAVYSFEHYQGIV